jgi:hypothetical protein
MKNNISSQMELGFEARACQPLTRRQKRLSRATWWFARMRQVVDHAIDWSKAPAPRPEQAFFVQLVREPAVVQEGRAEARSRRLRAA